MIKSYLIVGVMIAQQNNIYGICIKNYFQTLLQMNNYLISWKDNYIINQKKNQEMTEPHMKAKLVKWKR